MNNVETITLNYKNCKIRNISEDRGEILLKDSIIKPCNIIIPEQLRKVKITSICCNGFWNSSGILSIKMPDTIITIESYAFCNCKNLESMDMSNNLISIEKCAFNGCTHLLSIAIPNTVIHISEDAFAGCENLEIIYKGTKEQLDKLLTPRLIKRFEYDNIIFIPIPAEKIKEYINLVINNENYNIPTIINLSHKKYLLEEIDKAINSTMDLNKKLKLLTAYDNIDKQFVYENTQVVER